MKCNCDKKFEVPSCCLRYLEDARGFLVHTETVCYEKNEDGTLKRVLSTEVVVTPSKYPSFIPLTFTITSGSNE